MSFYCVKALPDIFNFLFEQNQSIHRDCLDDSLLNVGGTRYLHKHHCFNEKLIGGHIPLFYLHLPKKTGV